MDPNVLKKIKKCLALASSSEPHEAAAAMRQAQKLMQLHGLTEEQVEVGEITEEELKSACSTSKLKKWEAALVKETTEKFGVGVTFQRGRGYQYGKFFIVGPAGDTAVAKHTIIVLRRIVTKQRGDYLAKLKLEMPWAHTRDLSAKADSFALGYVIKAMDQVDKLARPDAYKNAVEKFIDAKTSGRQADSQNRRTNAEDLRAGHAAAADLVLRRAVDPAAQQRALGRAS